MSVISESGLSELLHRKRVLITVGAGGVGKTSTAAAIGLLGARSGRRTLVMTIDPARRLAASLGLESLDHVEREVAAGEAGLAPDRLFAMMLDQKQTFDELIRRHAKEPAMVERVMNNKLYRELSTRLAGGQEYAAMEKLYDLSTGGAYDLLVLDTPPTANALDFFDAPQKMVNLMESPAVALLINTHRASGRFSFKLLQAGAAFVFRRLARFVGGEFLDDLAQFFVDMQTLLGGFQQRATKVVELLAADEVGIVVVASPDARAVDEALSLQRRLGDGGMAPDAFILNRVHARTPVDLSPVRLAAYLAEHGVGRAAASRLAPVLLEAHERFQVLATADAREIERVDAARASACIVEVPLFEDDIHDIAGLSQLAAHLG